MELGEVNVERKRSSVPFDLDRYTKAGAARCREQHRQALARLAKAGELLDRFNRKFHELKLAGSPVENKSVMLEKMLTFSLNAMDGGDETVMAVRL